MLQYQTHQLTNTQPPYEDELDFQKVLSVGYRYQYSIIIIALISVCIAAYVAYFKPSVYEAQALLKVTSERQGYYEDFLMVTPMGTNSDVQDEMVVLKSRPIAQKALQKINIGTRYFTKTRFKTVELYKHSPFTVTYRDLDKSLYGRAFRIDPIDKNRFRLRIQPPLGLWQSIISLFQTETTDGTHDRIYRYGETIHTQRFTLTVNRISKLEKKPYWFTIVPNDMMTDFIQSGIDASTYSKYGNIIALKFYDTVPQRAAEILNRVIDAYIEQGLELKSEGAKKQLYFIDMQLNAINKTLKGSAEKLQEYKATNIVVDLSSKAQITSSKLSELESKLYELNMQLDIVESMYTQLTTQEDSVIFNVNAVEGGTPTVNALLSRIQDAMAKYATLSVNYTEQHPGIVKLKREISFLKRTLKKALQSNIKTLKKQKNRLLEAIEEQKERLKTVPEQEQQLEQLTRHFMVNEKIYSYLLEKRAETAILASSTISNSRVVEKATPPSSPIRPKRRLIVLIGLIIGLILGILQAAIRHLLDNTVKHTDDIEQNTLIPLYGTLPLIKSDKTKPVYIEAIRSLWVNLSFVKAPKEAKVIAVTSTVSGEGKTFTIYHLSKVIAKSSNRRVVVVDMDMRRSTLHEKFSITNDQHGSSTLLAGRTTLHKAVKRTEYENLDIITSGPKAPNPTKLIMSNAFKTLIETLSKEYHYVLIDTPPIGIVSDALQIMHHTDISLFMLKADYSKKEFLSTVEKLSRYEKLNIGIVLNGIDYTKSYYHYGYKSAYENYYTDIS